MIINVQIESRIIMMLILSIITAAYNLTIFHLSLVIRSIMRKVFLYVIDQFTIIMTGKWSFIKA